MKYWTCYEFCHKRKERKREEEKNIISEYEHIKNACDDVSSDEFWIGHARCIAKKRRRTQDSMSVELKCKSLVQSIPFGGIRCIGTRTNICSATDNRQSNAKTRWINTNWAFSHSDWVNNLWFTTEQMFRTFCWHENSELRTCQQIHTQIARTAAQEQKKHFILKDVVRKTQASREQLTFACFSFHSPQNLPLIFPTIWAPSVCLSGKYWLWLVWPK